MKVIILACGGCSRLFPLSRKSFPKQFLKLEDDKSLLAHTVERFLGIVTPKDIVIVTNKEYLYHVQNELAECHAEAAQVVLEPVGRNTAPAIALAAEFCTEKLGCNDDEVMIVAAADHIIRPLDVFEQCILQGEQAVKADALVNLVFRQKVLRQVMVILKLVSLQALRLRFCHLRRSLM